MWQRLIQERSSGYYGRLKKNQGKRPALIFTEGATEVSGSWQILSGGPPHFNGHRSAGATEYGTSTAGFALSRFMRHALRVIYQFDASALLPRQNAVRPVPVGRSLVRCMALNHLSSFQDAEFYGFEPYDLGVQPKSLTTCEAIAVCAPLRVLGASGSIKLVT